MSKTRFFLAALALAAAVPAQFTLVVPQGYDTAEGNSNNIYPWGRNSSSMRFQQIYDSTHFTGQGVISPILIQGMRFRADAVAATSTWSGGSWPNVSIDMSTSAVDYTAFSLTFAANHGLDQTNVLNGQVTVLPGMGLGAGVPGQYHVDIPLTTAFLYDPTSGNDLLFDVALDGAGWSGQSFRCDNVSNSGTPAPLASRLYNSSSHTATTASGSTTNYGLVCEFTYVPANGLYPQFTASPTEVPVNTPVNFTDQTYTSDPLGVLAWQWDVDGDGTTDYTTQNCTHSYATEGYYDVTLTATDATFGTLSITKTQYIEVDAVDASFTTMTLPGNLVLFTDTSLGSPTTWDWDVDGDGTTDYNTQNCAHTYPGPGAYQVSLTVTDAFSTDSTTVSLGVNIIPMPPFNNTYSNSGHTRGYWFTTPTKFSITSLRAADETMHGMQNVAVYRGINLGATGLPNGTQELEFVSVLQPSATPIPTVVSFDAGDTVCVLGAAGDTTIMHNSYGTGGASSVLGQPIQLGRLYCQSNLAAATSPETLSMIGVVGSSISRVFTGVTSCAGVPYGQGSPSGAGPAEPKMRCTALPFLGQTAVLSVEQNDSNAIGFMVGGLGRGNVPTPFGTILVGNVLFAEIMNGGAPVGPGTYTYSWNVPNNSVLLGVDANFQYAQLLPTTNQIAASNGIEMQFAQ